MGFSMAACLSAPGFDVVNRAGKAGWLAGWQRSHQAGRQAGRQSEWNQERRSGQA